MAELANELPPSLRFVPGRRKSLVHGAERCVHGWSSFGSQYPIQVPSGDPNRSHLLMKRFHD